MRKLITDRHALRGALIIGALTFGGCTTSSGSLPDDSTIPATSTLSGAAPTVAVPADSTLAPTSTKKPPRTTTSTTSTTEAATTTSPPATIPHGSGVRTTTIDGTPIDPDAAAAAQSVYDAAVLHDYDRLRDIIGDRRFVWGFTGERKPTDAWQAQFDSGEGDELARLATMLELPPGIDDRDNVVWPYLAVKDPAEWNLDDEALLRNKLGFSAENIDQTKTKGRYVDYRAVFDPAGLWTGFYLGH